jgi:6-phosphogluconolactonase
MFMVNRYVIKGENMKAITIFRTTLAAMAVMLGLMSPAAKAVTWDEDGAENGRVYVMTNVASGNTVIVFHRSEDGSLTRLQEVSTDGLGSGAGVLPPPLPPRPGPDPLQSQDAMVLSNDGRFLLVVNAGSNEISVFVVSQAGLRLVGKTSSGGTFPVSIALHGDLVYVLNEGESPDHSVGGTASIAGFRLGARGELSPIANSTRVIGVDTGTSDILFSPGGDTLVVTEMFTNRIDIFPMAADGTPGNKTTITSNGPTPFGAEFRDDNILAVTEINVIEVNGRRQGVPNASTMSSYRMMRDGSMQTISKAVPSHRTGSCWVRFSRDGRFAYTADTGSGTISIFAASPQGELSLQGIVSSGGAFSAPLDLDVTPDGKFLYVVIPFGLIANSPPLLPAPPNAGRIQGYRIEHDGSLTPVTTVGDIPFSVQGLVAR